MRGTRWLLLCAILAIIGGVGATYRLQRKYLKDTAPEKPSTLPLNLTGAAEDWQWSHSVEGRPVVQVRAKDFKQEKETGKFELGRVELKIFHKEGNQYDFVKSAHAEFSHSERRLYSEGEVEITLGVPSDGPPKKTPVTIRSSGVTFESTTGKASTNRATTFTFETGEGKAIGASYDPTTKELHMTQQVELHWKAPGAKPMKLESGELIYKEAGSSIRLMPWARLTRESTVIEAGDTVVNLKNGVIQTVEAQKAHGGDRYPKRQLEYSADQLSVAFTERGEVEKIAGQQNAKLISTSEGSATTVTSDRVDLDFQNVNGESTLTKAVANGNGTVESKPLPVNRGPLPETRLLHSQIIETKMRPGGREIDLVETHAPGRLEFLPNQPTQRRRTLDGERITVIYGPANQIQSFRSIHVVTQTEPSAQERAKNQATAKTTSQNLSAEFDPKTGQMTTMEQWDDFSYEEGERKAKAQHATLDSPRNLITLEKAARLWDSTGSTAADRIRLDQKSGDFAAEGHVNSSRLPDKKDGSSSELLSGDEPLQAVAQSMTSAKRNQLIHYEKNVVMWQGANRLQAARVDIDREKRRLSASGGVLTQFVEDNPAPAFTTVKAANLLYTEQDRLAHYTGGVLLTRPALQVKSTELKAYLAESGADSRLEKAYADGRVEILQVAADRTRKGLGEHGEYYTGEEKIILRGGEPQLIDSKRGNTRGAELTYWVNDDRLLVSGAPAKPATSRLHRK